MMGLFGKSGEKKEEMIRIRQKEVKESKKGEPY